MLHAGGHIVGAYIVGSVALKSEHTLAAHFGVEIGVFAIVFPHSRPTRVASEVGDRRISPRNACGACLICADFGTAACEAAVESGAHVYTLWEKCAAEGVCSAVNLVDTIDARNAHCGE